MTNIERLKIAIEEVAMLRTGCELVWEEKLDEEARTISIGFISVAEHHTLGRKLKDDAQLAWEAEATTLAREQGLAPMPYPAVAMKPITPELIEKYRLEIFVALLREGAVNTKF